MNLGPDSLWALVLGIATKGEDNRRDSHDCFLDLKEFSLNFSIGLDGDRAFKVKALLLRTAACGCA